MVAHTHEDRSFSWMLQIWIFQRLQGWSGGGGATAGGGGGGSFGAVSGLRQVARHLGWYCPGSASQRHVPFIFHMNCVH
jgi:hypothetical protein